MFRACQYDVLSRLFSDQSDSKDIEAYLGYLAPPSSEHDSAAAAFSRQLRLWLNSKEPDHLLRTEYARLFIMPGGIRPYESVYRGKVPLLMQEPWLEAKQFYRRCGLKLENPSRHPEDHISSELAFMLYLIEMGNRKAEEKAFFRQHIDCWVPQMLEDIKKHTHAHFFKDVANFGRAFLESEREYLSGDNKDTLFPPAQLQGSDK